MRARGAEIRAAFEKLVGPCTPRFDLPLWGGVVAVCSLGHPHPEIKAALTEQAGKLIHVSNLYYNELQARLAKRIVDLIAPGRVFFCNSGAEANEGLFKFARKFGHQGDRASLE